MKYCSSKKWGDKWWYMPPTLRSGGVGFDAPKLTIRIWGDIVSPPRCDGEKCPLPLLPQRRPWSRSFVFFLLTAISAVFHMSRYVFFGRPSLFRLRITRDIHRTNKTYWDPVSKFLLEKIYEVWKLTFFACSAHISQYQSSTL